MTKEKKQNTTTLSTILNIEMAKFKAHRSFSRIVKNVLKSMTTMLEAMETPETNMMWSPIEAPVQLYTRTKDSGYISTSLNKESNPKIISENNKITQARMKWKESGLHMGMDYELAAFWDSAESPYWPCRTKTLLKVEVDCLLDTNEDFVKHIIKTVYHFYQESCVHVDGTTDHVSEFLVDILKSQTNESLLSTNNEITLFDVNSSWNVQVTQDADPQKDIQSTFSKPQEGV